MNPLFWQDFAQKWALNQKGGLVARIARWRVLHWIAIQKLGFHRWVEARLFFGEKMWVLTGETISTSLLAFGYAESALTALMLQVIRPGMRVVDIGAHLGYEALLASALVGDSGKVVSFEPHPQISPWTQRNLGGLRQTRLVRSAVGDREGTMLFSEMSLLESAFSGGNPNAPGRRITVPVTRLSSAMNAHERPVHFIKCDVEGGEMAVLRGAADILKADQPLLVLEAEMPGESRQRPCVKEFADFLSPLGYQGVSFEFDGELKLAALGGLREGHANVAFVPTTKMDWLPRKIR